jgi:hypothetical protein
MSGAGEREEFLLGSKPVVRRGAALAAARFPIRVRQFCNGVSLYLLDEFFGFRVLNCR